MEVMRYQVTHYHCLVDIGLYFMDKGEWIPLEPHTAWLVTFSFTSSSVTDSNFGFVSLAYTMASAVVLALEDLQQNSYVSGISMRTF